MSEDTRMDLLRQGVTYLAARGVEEPRLEADLLLAYALTLPRDRLYIEPTMRPTPAQAEVFWQAVRRRGRRVPYAYVTGEKEFWGLTLRVDERVLIPRPETECLVETALRQGLKKFGLAEGESLRCLDLCTGSGAVVLAIAASWREWQRLVARLGAGSDGCGRGAVMDTTVDRAEPPSLPDLLLVATDISEEALAVARVNGAKLGLPVIWRQGDLWAAVAGERFDVVTVNPPYVSETEYLACAPEVRREPDLALMGGPDGLDFYRRLAVGATAHLRPKGRLYMEIGWQQGAAVRALFAEVGFVTAVYQDLAGRDRVVEAIYRSMDGYK